MTVYQQIKMMEILESIAKDTVIDHNWHPYLKSDSRGKQILWALKKISGVNYITLLQKHEGEDVEGLIKTYYI